MMMFDGISVGSGSFAHLPPSNVAGLAVTLAVLHGEPPLLPLRPGRLPLLAKRTCWQCSAVHAGPTTSHSALVLSVTNVLSPLHQSSQLNRCVLFAVGRQAGLGLAAVWWALIAFYGTRLLGHLVHFARSGGGVFAGPPAGSTAAAAAAG
jgi:hypothetical protein